MTTTTAPQAPAVLGNVAARHPLGTFFALAFGLSWPAFILAAVVDAEGLIVVGAFGPAAAGAITVRLGGESAGRWFRGAWRWRVPLRYYAFALGCPPLLVACAMAGASIVGETFDLEPAARLVPGYVATLLLVAALGGGQEEPGWRGFALERLQRRHSAAVATVILGVVWGAWHLPVYGLAGFAGPALFAVFYTWLYARTASVAVCVVLHGSFNTAVGYLELDEHGLTVALALLLVTAAAAAALVATTGLSPPVDRVGGHVQMESPTSAAPHEELSTTASALRRAARAGATGCGRRRGRRPRSTARRR